MSSDGPQRYIAAECETNLARHGDNWRGAGYTHSREEAEERYSIMLGLIREEREPVSVLDFGCGLAHMLEHIERMPQLSNVRYSGLDISESYITAARARRPDADLIVIDVLESDAEVGTYDYVLMNGIFNFRGDLPRDQMHEYWKRLLTVAYTHCRRGLAFNVMSKLVDWERDDLFHLPLDVMSQFLWSELSRHFVVRHDYRAYEYTTYVYRDPSDA